MAYAQKRGKTWTAHWQTDEILPNGRKKEGTLGGFPTKKAALEYGQDREAEVRAGTYIDPAKGKTLLRDWWAQWFPTQTWKPNTVEAYTQQWTCHIEPRWGSTPLAGIRPVKVDEWLKELGQRLSASTLTVITAAMRGALDAAVENELIRRSPMPAPGKRGRKRAAPRPKRAGIVIQPQELREILLRLTTDADRLLVVTAVFTGMRWSEVAAMRRDYLELTPPDGDRPASGHYTIDALDGAVHEDRHGRRFTGPPKSGGGRIMDFPPFLVLLWLAHLATLPVDQEILLPNRDGGFRRYDDWNHNRWRRAVDGQPASVSRGGRSVREAVPPVHKGLRFHDTKHTAASIMDDKRVHKVMRDNRLGHQIPGAPGVYAQPTPKMRRELVDALEETWTEWGLDLARIHEEASKIPNIRLTAVPELPLTDNTLF